MSRRQSRIPADTRQNDTLLEFENFKKKFLLANKHITKLNSTLSVRIEELNAQISTLYVENLRLRASEIALTSQLKKEREKSRKILADAETATHTLMRQLGHIRKSFHVPHRSSTPESPPPAPLPRAKRPIVDPNVTPPAGRIARPPGIPGIFEDEEDQSEADDLPPSPSPPRRKSKPRSSTSRLPVQSTTVEQAPLPSLDDHLGKSGKRKPTRRQSGLLTTSMSITTLTPKGYTTEIIPPRPPSPAFGSPLRRDAAMDEEDDMLITMQGREEEEGEEEEDLVTLSVTRRDSRKRKNKERESESDRGNERDTGDEDARGERSRRRGRDPEEGPSSYEGKKPKLKDVTNSPPPRPSLISLDTPHERDRQRAHVEEAPRPSTSTGIYTPRTFLTSSSRQDSQLPTPRSSSPLPQGPASEPESSAAGRERRVRKSINYAEPKLNTKMRKPDPAPSAPTSKRSSSASESRKSVGATVSGAATTSGSSTESGTAQPPPQVAGVKRKKSRVHIPVDDNEESDGTQADAEFGAGLKAAAGSEWVNSDGRRRSVHTSGARRVAGEELRRHSMAV